MYINLETKGVGKERDRIKMMVTSALNLEVRKSAPLEKVTLMFSEEAWYSNPDLMSWGNEVLFLVMKTNS